MKDVCVCVCVCMGMYLPEHEWFVGWIDLCSIKWFNVFNMKKKIVGCFVMYAMLYLTKLLLTSITSFIRSSTVHFSFFSFSYPLNHKQANKLLYFPLQHSRAFSFVVFFLLSRAVSAHYIWYLCK